MDEMDEYRERIERRYGPDRRAPKIEPKKPSAMDDFLVLSPVFGLLGAMGWALGDYVLHRLFH